MIPEAEREQREVLLPDMCLIDEEHGFIVGNLEIPVLDSDQTFSWDVWVSLSLPHFKRTFQLWEQEGRESEPPYFGWLCTGNTRANPAQRLAPIRASNLGTSSLARGPAR
jgi:hypothetical protein